MSSKKEAPQLTEYYHRARRNLTITSSLLLGWEFIGASFDEKATLPVVGFVIHIRNPEVTPLTLAFFVLFFSFRLWIEWKQCDIERVKSVFSKADLISVYVIASASIALFGFQQTSSVDLAKLIEQYTALIILLMTVFMNFIAVYVGFANVKFKYKMVNSILNDKKYSIEVKNEMYEYKYNNFISSGYGANVISLVMFSSTAFLFYFVVFSEYVPSDFYKAMLWFSGPLLVVFIRMVYQYRIRSLFSCSWPRESFEA